MRMIVESVRTQPQRSAGTILGLSRYLSRLSEDGFFGEVRIVFQEGDIVLVRKEESFKPAAFLVVE